ncbi:MAG: hypothetical protein MR784_03890, partial [Rikenellaceae bacterium]|nr:hypothetical protein [Rikenellaceae bacterium]
KKVSFGWPFCVGEGTTGAQHPNLCLGALPLLYPAAPPSVFAVGKYTAAAVALERDGSFCNTVARTKRSASAGLFAWTEGLQVRSTRFPICL